MDLLFGHISDTHLGAAPYGRPEREDDFYEALDEALEVLLREGVRFIVHSGDVFDAPRPPGTALNHMARKLRELRDRGIGLYFVLGEHDISRMRETPSSLIYDTLGLATELGRPGPDGAREPVLEMGGDVEIMGLHKRRKSESERLRGELARIGSMRPRGRLRILVLHQGIYEADRYASEISAQDLPRNFNYYAMGHLHDRYERRFEFLGGPLCYPGSTELTLNEGIREKEKGVYLVDASGDEPSAQWIKLEGTRPHIRRSTNYGDLDRFVSALAEELRGMAERPMLDVEIEGRREEMRNDVINTSLRRLEGLVLYYQWERKEIGEAGRIVREKPEDLRGKMRELAVHALGDEALASFALDELLPLLRDGDPEGAADVLYRAFREGRFG
ncbi:MAG: metallophosphoesterase [Conexivisphaera sp.]